MTDSFVEALTAGYISEEVQDHSNREISSTELNLDTRIKFSL
jgi:hypothetical protein